MIAIAMAAAPTGIALNGKTVTAEPKPNVLLIETDDQSVEEMKVMRNVNSLIGARGATFRNSFVNYSLCCPSRATVLTGQYAHNHRVWSNKAPNGGFDGFEALHADNNLALWLQNAGYYTGMIGKYLNNYRNDPPVPPGWSEWQAAAPDEQAVYDYTFNNGGKLTNYGAEPTDFKQDVLTRKAVNLISRRAPKAPPFFVWLAYTAPHASEPNPRSRPPFDCLGAAQPATRHEHSFDSQRLPIPPNFNESDVSDKPDAVSGLPLLDETQVADIERKYRCALESLLSVDDGVKRVLDALQATGELENTLIIYTSDNGFFHGEHRIAQGKTRIYEESVRVPLEMRGPGIPAGVNVHPPVINADLAPTIVDATNARAGLQMDGRSLLPVVAHPGVFNTRELLIEQPTVKAIRTPRYMYGEYMSGDRELYDLQSDPGELQSLDQDPAYAPTAVELANRLHQLETCAAAGCRVYQPDPVGPPG
jgi:N-acetylglucosamine-6-sulfatase